MPTKKKDEVSDLLREIDKECSGAEKVGRELSQSARLGRDLVACTTKLVDAVQDDSDLSPDEWSGIRAPFEALRHQAVQVQQTDFRAFTSTVSATGLTMTTIIDQLTRPAPAGFQYAAKDAAAGVYQIFARHDLISQITERLSELGLDRRSGNKQTPIEQLEDAKLALDRPSHGEGVPVAILIPLRECIQTVVEGLMKRRKRQEEARAFKAKILSIGDQCGRAGLALDHFARLAEDGHPLINKLSAGKDTAMSRNELGHLFQQGALFLKTLLDSIDETKLRR
jgi:hypothetical protein